MDTVALTEVASGKDVRAALRATLALRRLADEFELLQVTSARRQGWSWQDIAEALQISKQAVHKKYSRIVTDQKG